MVKEKILRNVFLTLCMIVLFYVGLYIVGLKSEPYKYAIKYINKNAKVIGTMGSLINYRLSFWGYSVRDSDTEGTAKLKIIIKGNINNGIVYLSMEKKLGKWKISQGRIVLEGGEEILLNRRDRGGSGLPNE